MAPDSLLELGLAAEDTVHLSSRSRDRLIQYLLRWQQHPELGLCLDALLAQRTLLSLLDVRAQMLLDQGRLDEAWQTVCQRHERSASISSKTLASRILLARGEQAAAVEAVKALLSESPESSTAWSLLGDVRLALGDCPAALAAYRRVNDLAPDSRAYLLGMMATYQAQGNWVSASGYAVRLQQSATAESPLLVSHLRRLRTYFQQSGESNRAADIDAELETRRRAETESLREALAQECLPHPAAEPASEIEASGALGVEQRPSPATLPDSFEAVAVSLEEQGVLRGAAMEHFGFHDLLPGQAQIMSCVRRGEDVLAVLPTGGGKSLCYQLPALLAPSGTTLVISPLIALMKDQVDKMPQQVAALATTINSTIEGGELNHRLQGIRQGNYRLVYAAPERLRQPPFLHALRQAGVSRLVVDEVHCVSMWGHDFRPDYLYIAEARRALGNPPLLGLTATAPPRVRKDIQQRLGTMHTVAGDVLRSNLRLEVFHARNADEKLRQLLDLCHQEDGAGIVYADTRARCEQLAALLRSVGVAAIHYHAGLEERAAVQDEFMSSRARVVVATVAFGMGIDKPDIRFILHFAPAPSIEQYYQEAGRAGRDGLPARCVLFYAPSDRGVLSRRASQDVLSEPFVQEVYAAIRQRLGPLTPGRVALDDVRRDVQADEVPVRVAISILEQAGFLRRWQDVPRAANVRLLRTPPDSEPDLAAFCRAAQLRRGQSVSLDLVETARRVDTDPLRLEGRLLAWADQRCMQYRPSRRDPLLQILDAPQEAREELRLLLDRYEKVQRQRVAEIFAYATTRRCRHGHISAYLGGRPITHCQSCDNCLRLTPTETQPVLPDETQQAEIVLNLLGASHGWGRHNLALILRGDPSAPQAARCLPGFGALAYRSEGGIGKLVDRLISEGLLEAEPFRSSMTICITPRGRQALRDPNPLPKLDSTQIPAPVQPQASQPILDEPLFERLRAWRREKAQLENVSAFVVAHDSLLRSIATLRPCTEADLLAAKGMGPRKFEKYGAELLALVRDHLEKQGIRESPH